MASNLDTLVTVFGGSVFWAKRGPALCKRDYRVRVAVRRPELAGHLQRSARSARSTPSRPICAIRIGRGRDARFHIAINLVGILTEGGAQTFDAVQGAGAGAVAQAAAAAGARWCMFRPSAPMRIQNRVMPRQGRRRKGRAVSRSLRDDPAAFVVFGPRISSPTALPRWPGYRGAAADRRRRDQNAAGLCRRCRDRGCGRRRRQGQGRRDL